MGCRKIPKKADKICAGDLNKQIKIINRAIVPADISHTINRDDYITVWARVDTRRGGAFFNGTNMEDAPTHFFYVRFGVEVENNFSIELSGNYYMISNIENLNEENRWLKISATKRGIATNESTFA